MTLGEFYILVGPWTVQKDFRRTFVISEEMSEWDCSPEIQAKKNARYAEKVGNN